VCFSKKNVAFFLPYTTNQDIFTFYKENNFIMNKRLLFLSIITFGVFVIFSCKPKVAPVSERIAKIWTASSVKENGTEVYKTGGTSNTKPGYSTYKLDLSTPPNVTIREIDGGTYTGTYSVTATTLSIKGLTPQPTGTGGNLDFSITSLSDDGISLVLTGTTPYPKTGNTTNTYTLTTSN
jgi:hypothetical protein